MSGLGVYVARPRGSGLIFSMRVSGLGFPGILFINKFTPSVWEFGFSLGVPLFPARQHVFFSGGVNTEELAVGSTV